MEASHPKCQIYSVAPGGKDFFTKAVPCRICDIERLLDSGDEWEELPEFIEDVPVARAPDGRGRRRG